MTPPGLTTTTSIPGRGSAAPCPPSFAQERLWFLDQVDPRSPLYNVVRAYDLTGPLNLGALQAALDAVVARHEALRTTLHAVDGQPVQVIAAPCSVSLALVELTGAGPHAGPEAVQGLLAEEARRPFDLSRDLMLRATVFRLHAEKHIVLLAMHHVASDGWSLGLLVRELAEGYAAHAGGRRPTLPDLPIQYADYAQWQRDELRGPALERALTYWSGQLANLAPLDLPADRPRPARQRHRGARQAFRLPDEVTSALKVLSRQARVTFFMTLLAAFQTLLSRYSGADDVAVGSPIAGRTRPELEGLIGFFVNTLVLRGDLSGNPTFHQLLGRIKTVALDAYDHQDLPFEKLVAHLQPTRTLSHTPLVQVMLALDNTPAVSLALPEITTRPIEVETGTAKCDLVLFARDTGRGLVGSMAYDTDLFEAATIQRMLGHFETLLAGIAADPGQRLSALPLLTSSERRQVLVEWNDTRRDYPSDRSIPELFEAQVGETPDAVALAFEGRSLTYGELNRRANQLAHHLRGLGVGPEVPVGICVERSFEMIVGVLGILKAGGAYVPLDGTHPRQRLAFMLEDTRASVLVTQERWRPVFPEHGIRIVCLDADGLAIAQASGADPVDPVEPENLAYVMYTSGSTGRPKGVGVTHRAVARLVKNTSYARLGAGEVLLQLAPLAFDASTFEIWGSLLNGARLAIAPPGVLSGAALGRALRHHEVTTLWLTAAYFHQVVDEGIESVGHVRQLLAGGDVLSVPHVASVLRERPLCHLINGYGPTESTTFACCFHVSDIGGVGSSVPIGRPIANTRVYVLDRGQAPVPIGVPGELYIGGDGLARGYLHRPDLTAERFVPDPFAERPGARLYRTGDLVRYRPDGDLEFLGRLDDQVKIRGFRVEPGEIEAVLREHPAVRDVVLVARADAGGEKQLVAYVVSPPDRVPSAGDLRGFLLATLPAYMVPAAFAFMDTLPLTPSGKVDRGALPARDASRPVSETELVGPRTPMEEQLLRIWEGVLNVRPIGIHDNFFDLGGHSLLAARLFARIEKTLGEQLSLATLFEAPTIEQLAGRLRQAGPSASWSSLVALQPNGSKPVFFWIHGEQSNAFLPRHLGPDQPFYGFLHQSQDGRPAVYTSVESIVAHYLEEIRRVRPEGPYVLGGFCFGGTLAFAMAQQLRRHGHEVALLLLLDPTRPGHRRALPFRSRLSKWLRGRRLIREGIRREVRRLAPLGPREKLTAMVDVVKEKTREELTRITEIGKKIACTVYLLTGTASPIPLAFRNVYLEGVYRRAARGYVPTVYPGRVIVLRTEGGSPDPRGAWEKLAGGGLEIVTVPGKHTEIVFKEAQIQGLAKQLKACLDKAEADGWRDHGS